MKFVLILLLTILYSSFSSAEMPSFKFTLGSNVGNIPLEIKKMSNNIKTLGGLKINSWILSPNFSSFAGNKITSKFLEKKNSKDSVYIKFKLNF